ncbi:phage portal protein family protein [Pedobacter sp. NJ-S-72]
MFNSRIGRGYANPNAAAKPTSKNSDIGVIQQLAAEFADLSRKDIQAWRAAIEAASNPETPRWALLQDLYEYLRPDAHLGSQMDIRRGLSESVRYYIRDSKTNKEDPVKSKTLEVEWVFDAIGDLIDHEFFGYTIMQIVDPILGIYQLLPRRNFIPQKNLLLFEANGDKGIDVTDPAFKGTIIVVRSRNQFGIMNDIVPDLIWKKNARQAWAMFAEKFGIPMTTATTRTRDKKELDRIEAMLKSLGKASQAIFPEGTTLDIKDSAAKGDPHKYSWNK